MRSADISASQDGYTVCIWNQLRQTCLVHYRWFRTLDKAEAFAQRWDAGEINHYPAVVS